MEIVSCASPERLPSVLSFVECCSCLPDASISDFLSSIGLNLGYASGGSEQPEQRGEPSAASAEADDRHEGKHGLLMERERESER